jgi:hypothetical protein
MTGPMPADAMSPVPAPGLGSGRMTWAGRLSAPDPGLGRLRLGMLGTVTAAAALVPAAIALLMFGRLPDVTNDSGSARASCRCTCIIQEP